MALITENHLCNDWMQGPEDHEALSGTAIVTTQYDNAKCKNQSNDDDFIEAILLLWDSCIADEVARTRVKPDSSAAVSESTYRENVFEPLKRTNNITPPRQFIKRGSTFRKTITCRMIEHANEVSPVQGELKNPIL
jgi:hypothetical protein